MKIKTSELTGAALDWAVAKCVDDGFANFVAAGWPYDPSTNWEQGGPIIERKRIQITTERGRGWVASSPYAVEIGGYRKYIFTYGLTPLIAAMRCHVTSELGDEVEVPDELV